MKATIDSEVFAGAVGWVARAVDVDDSLAPEMAGIELAADGDLLTLRTRDRGSQAVVVASAAVHGPGTVAVSEDTLAKVVRVLGGAVQLHTDPALRIVTSRASYRLPALPEGDRGDIAPATEVRPTEGLARALDGADRFCATDKAREVLTAVHLVARDGVLHVEATDSYHLMTRGLAYAGPPLDVIVPARHIALAATGPGDPELRTDPLAFVWPDRALSASSIDGRFPDVEALMPKGVLDERTAIVGAHDLAEAIERVKPVADVGTGTGNWVDVLFEEGSLLLSGARSGGDWGSGDTLAAADVAEKLRGLGLRFNARLLVNCALAVRSERVRIVPAENCVSAGCGVVEVLGDDDSCRTLCMTVRR